MILRTNLSSLRAAVFYPLIVVFAAVQMASGVDRSTYTTVNGAGVTPATLHKSWMSALPDAMLISELSIPGTHDAGCISQYGDVGSPIADCQDAKIIDQLNAGVRFLDLRVEDSNGPWEIFHDAYQYERLWDVLTQIATFLTNHPRETVLTRITVFESDHEAFLFQWPSIFGGAFKKFIWQQKDDFRADGVTPTTYAHDATGDPNIDRSKGNQSYVWPTLGEVRGKMVLFFGRADPLLNEGRGHASGLGYVGHYPLTTLASSRTSGAGIVVGVTRDLYGNANTDNKWEGDEIIINAASADQTKETLYTTGINIGATGVEFNPSLYASVMNRKLLDKLNSDTNVLRKTGLVLMDYPGPGLLDSIIALNFRHATSSAAMYDDFVQYARNLPFEDKVVSDSVASGVPIVKIWRRLVKDRLPSAEFNTYIVNVPGAASLNVSSSISPTDRNFLAAAFKQGDSFHAIFESNRLPPKVTKNQVKQKLDALYAAGDFGQKTNPNYFKAGFDLAYPDHNWVVFRIDTASALPSAQFDFDENVVWESKFGASGIFSETLIVAGSAKPEPAVESGVSHPAVVGQWDFNKGDLTATVGQDLVSSDGNFSPGPDNIFLPRSTTGLKVRHGAAPNGGPSAARLNQWTLVMDILAFPFNSNGTLISLFQTDSMDNSTDGEVFIRQLAPFSSPQTIGIGTKGNYFGSIPNGLRRVVVAVDATQDQLMSFYIDGNKVGELTSRTFAATGFTYSEQDRWSLGDQAILFGDDNGESGGLYVYGVQLRNYKMSDAEVAALRGPSAAGIPDDTMTLAYEVADGPGLDKSDYFERMETNLLKNQFKLSWNPIHQLQQSDSPGGPWVDVPTTESPRFFNPAGVTRQFFRLRSR